MFRKLDAVILFTRDLKRAISFYKDDLGLPLHSATNDTAEFFTSGTRIVIRSIDGKAEQEEEAGKATRPGILVGFTVQSIDELCELLKKKGVRFLKEPREEAFGKHAIILDPDGHMISLAELKGATQEEFDLLGAIGTE
ncbi:MAG: VOC family protein [Candidatus Nitrosocaldus sp.]|nr:VOC family protein [Candidatus Nitrosocaldus sp.]MCS7141661.1 VOC family protein [Candidatus Nitrosocaldus sp.]MDW8000680.1 VOC family protein [Candidatus Nitrosocaldus sp.]MDW8276253.1 VOC family protein [Candidatus Nitrosocaldus sp.]